MARNVRRRGVSPVIASLLLIAIAVAAAVVTYSWVMTMISTQGRQAQTSIRIDEVLFGEQIATAQSATWGYTTEDTTQTSTTTTIYVSSATGFAEGDFIKVELSSGAYGYTKITAVSGNTLTVSPALPESPKDGGSVREVKYGFKVTIRNTGSVVAVIDAIYVYKGSDLIMKAELTSGNAISAGDVKSFGIVQASDVTWANLKPSMGSVDTTATASETTTYLEVSTGYVVKVITDTGFSTEGTYYSPSSWS